MGQINIGGANAAVQLQGNDTITTDQAFSFPPQGGQLACYQQGLWTPVLSDGVANTANPIYITNYTRIGNSIFVNGRIAFTPPNSNNRIEVTGLPYPVSSSVWGTYVGSAMNNNQSQNFNGGIANNMAPYGLNSSILFYWQGTNGAFALVPWAGFRSGVGGAEIIFNMQYLTDNTSWSPAAGASVQGSSVYQAMMAERETAMAAFMEANPDYVDPMLNNTGATLT